MNVRPQGRAVPSNFSSPQRQRSTRGSKSTVDDPNLEGTVKYSIIALRDIKEGEEILMSYGDDYWSHRPHTVVVQCKEHQGNSQKKGRFDDTDDDEDDLFLKK